MENKNAYENNEEVSNSLREDDERMNLYTDRNEHEQDGLETPEHSDDVIILGSSYPQEETVLSQEKEAMLDSPTALQTIVNEKIADNTQEAMQINEEVVKEETMQQAAFQVQEDITISDDREVHPVTQHTAMPAHSPEESVDNQESVEQTNPQSMESHTQEYASFVQARENAKASQQKSIEDEMLTEGSETVKSDLPHSIDYEEEVMQTLAAETKHQSAQTEPQAHEEFASVHHASEARHVVDDQSCLDQAQYAQEEDPEANGDNGSGNRKNRSTGSFLQRHRNASIAAGCLLLSIGGGFGGTLAAISLNKVNGSGAVLYQSVSNTSTGNSKKANGNAMSVKDVANKTMESVVEIKTESVSNNSFFQQAVQSGAGSGVILSKDGYIVSNNHVISGANKIMVTTKDGKSYEAKLIGTDASSDLAILKIEADNLIPAIMGSSSDLEVGDTAIAIGNPLGELGGTVTSGIISALDREINIDNQTMHLLQTNAAINPGNSGGGLFNDQGELIGVVNAKSSGESIEGLGFAIPMDRAKSIITNLIENGYVKGRASLGVSLTVGSSNPFSQETENQVYIYQVVEGKAADKAGLQKGDLILKVDDKKVAAISDVANAVNSHKAGEKIKITILRESETKTVEVTLGEADATNSEDNAEKSTNNNR